MLQLTDKLIGMKFTGGMDKSIEYTCVGWAQNTALLIVGVSWDQASNRFRMKTFKPEDCNFVGAIPV